MKDTIDLVIIDDDNMTLSSTARLMRSQGYNVRESGTAGGGFELIRERKPDLVLSDVDLPDYSGIELCGRIKSDDTFDGTYVIMISNSSTDSDAQAHAMELGADGYIARPIPNRELLARVKAFLRIQAAESAVRTKVKQQNEIITIGHMGLQGHSVESMIEETRRCAARGIGVSESLVRFIPGPATMLSSDTVKPLCLNAVVEGAQGVIGYLEVSACPDGPYSREDESFLHSAATILSLAVIRRQNEETIAFMARHDSLTGLWNRRHFDELLAAAALSRNLPGEPGSSPNGQLSFPLGILMADVDRLKQANDNYGHSSGDGLLRFIARHLASAFPPPAIVARIGGDEFAILVPESHEARILQAIEKLQALVAEPGHAAETGLPEAFNPSVSIGWAFAESPDTVNSALVNADESMYDDKRQKRSGR